MGLKSHFLRGDERLEACLIKDEAHIYAGLTGAFVSKIQYALICVDDFRPASNEFPCGFFGPTTKAAVHKFKSKRGIINFAYETKVDDIVGKMTIARLDAELAELEQRSDACIGV